MHTQADLIRAFVELTDRGADGKHVAFSMRGKSKKSYVNVFGPTRDPKKARTASIVVEYDGSVCFKDHALAQAVGAEPRNRGKAFPKASGAKWMLSAAGLGRKHASALGAVRQLVAEAKKHGVW